MTRKEVIALRKQIESAATLQTDKTALDSKWMFPEWQSGTAYEIGSRVRRGSKLYKCVTAHSSQSDWIPDIPSALWAEISSEEWAEWKQPTGIHDAYSKDDKCAYNGKHYICRENYNVYAPDIYGWELIG